LLIFLLPRLGCRLLLGARVKVRDPRLKRVDGHSTRIRFTSVDVNCHPSSRGADRNGAGSQTCGSGELAYHELGSPVVR
jgi:hypothetical protein